MMKTALLFAGQGAQVVGMGKDLAAAFPSARAWFDRADEVLGYDITRICFEGPEEELTRTENAQPGIYLVGWVAFQLLKERWPGLVYDAVAGLSLGEITALAAAGVLSFEDGLRIVRQRGQFMQKACDDTKGGMAAVIGLDEEATQQVCSEAGVELANLNCPGQIVISGPVDHLDRACELAKAKGAKKALLLTVAGAYHSQLMKDAGPKLQAALADVHLEIPSLPVISNVTAAPHGAPGDIHRRLVEQVTSSVRWEASVRYLLGIGCGRFIELGPGTALSGFMRRIERSAQMLNISDVSSLEKTLAANS